MQQVTRPAERGGDRAAGSGNRRRRGGPGPSKLAYRLARAWAKPSTRGAVIVYLPLVLLGLVGWRLVADDHVRAALLSRASELSEALAARPEFAIEGVGVSGGSAELRRRLETRLRSVVGLSSLKLDVAELRRKIESIGAVESAEVRVDAAGVLRVDLTERVAAALYRSAEGRLVILDRSGAEIGPVRHRVSRPDLPLVLGEGAKSHIDQAISLLTAAPELRPRIRALVWVGERRWDIVLGDDVIVMLPEDDPLGALAQVMAWQYGEEVLDRDIAAVDMRLPGRPIVRMTRGAAEAFRLRQSVAGEAGEDT